jgi:hypothetical protein
MGTCARLPKNAREGEGPGASHRGSQDEQRQGRRCGAKSQPADTYFSHDSSSQVESLKFLAKLAYLALANLKVRNSRGNV